jgi:hypothetical protein
MKATVLDLRYRMNDVLKALRRNEKVKVYYHGRMEGTIVPSHTQQKKPLLVKDHPIFGMYQKDSRSVNEVMNHLRKPRYENL